MLLRASGIGAIVDVVVQYVERLVLINGSTLFSDGISASTRGTNVLSLFSDEDTLRYLTQSVNRVRPCPPDQGVPHQLLPSLPSAAAKMLAGIRGRLQRPLDWASAHACVRPSRGALDAWEILPLAVKRRETYST